jgi:hypothetical protein
MESVDEREESKESAQAIPLFQSALFFQLLLFQVEREVSPYCGFQKPHQRRGLSLKSLIYLFGQDSHQLLSAALVLTSFLARGNLGGHITYYQHFLLLRRY